MTTSRYLISAAFLAVLMPACANAQAPAPCYPATADKPLEKELVIETTGGSVWDTMRQVLITPFEKACGVTVQLTVNPQRNIAQLKSVVQNQQVTWDVGVVNTPWDFATGMKEDLFEPLPAGFWDPYKDKLISGSYNDYALWLNPYSTVIISNTKKFPEGPKSWADFWDQSKFPGPRTMQDSPVNILIALNADGVAAKDIYPITNEKLARAFKKLDEIRPNIRNFWTSGDVPVQGVQRGDFALASAFNGRAFSGIRSGYDVKMQWEGNVQTTTWFYRPKGTAHPMAAAAFMAFINSPEIQKDFAEKVGYTGATDKMEEQLPKDLAELIPLSSTHRAQSITIDAAWWAENGARMQQLWKEWVATRRVTIQ